MPESLRLVVILARQHGDKPGRWDVGASCDIDGDGTIQPDEQEVNITPGYIGAAVEQLSRTPHVIAEVWGLGPYSWQHERAAAIALRRPRVPVLYLACHANAGGGDAALVGADVRSGWGKVAAGLIADELGELPGIDEGQVLDLVQDAPQRYRRNMLATIDGIFDGPPNLSGAIIEAGFLDQPKHAHLWTPQGLQAIGEAIARGCMAYADKRQ